MPRLLTLSLTETTRERESYQVISRDLDQNRWVMMYVPRSQFREGAEPVWDLFGVTSASYLKDPRDPRPEKCRLDSAAVPLFQNSITDHSERLRVMSELSMPSVQHLYEADDAYIGVVPIAECSEIVMRPKANEQRLGYDLANPFFWEARICFRDVRGGVISSIPCKDLRWKHYWLNVVSERADQLESLKKKWLDYMNSHKTFFIIEIYPPLRGTNYCAVSGVHCMPSRRNVSSQSSRPAAGSLVAQTSSEFDEAFRAPAWEG